MTKREAQILEWIRENPMISQQELADRAGITRSSVGVHIANLMKKGFVLGRGYLLGEEEKEAKKEQPIENDGLSNDRKAFINKVTQMSDAEFDRLKQILSLVENTKQ